MPTPDKSADPPRPGPAPGRATPGRRALIQLLALGGAAVGAVEYATRDAAAGAVGRAATGPTTIMIIRHAEEPENEEAPGIDAEGRSSQGSLSVQGWVRAGALVQLLAPQGTALRSGLVRPDRIFAARPKGDAGQRPSQTVTPLAARLGLSVETPFGKGDEDDLAERLLRTEGRILVSWQHKEISDLIEALGGARPAPPAKWPGERFDLVWVFTRDGDGWAFSQVPQLLLAGDSADPAR